jgi:hypothetical protein
MSYKTNLEIEPEEIKLDGPDFDQIIGILRLLTLSLIITIVFVFLRIFGTISWSWIWIISPIWIGILIILIKNLLRLIRKKRPPRFIILK